MTTQLNVGDSYTITPGTAGTDAGTKGLPPWMEWSNGTAQGSAELPSGYRRITLAGYSAGQPAGIIDKSVDILPVSIPADTTSPWRCIIYAPNGAYIIANGMGGVPTIGTPKVRLTRSAPSRLEVSFAMGTGRHNPLGASFDKWSDGTARPLARGMEVTTEYRDETTGALMLVFRGRIFQIESGEAIKVTAYDRLMDLYQTTGQYLSHAGQTQGVRTTDRTVSGSDYIYETGETLGIITGLDSIDRLDINGSGQTSTSLEGMVDRIIIHSLPTAGGITPEAGDTITSLQVKYGAEARGATTASGGTKIAAIQAKCDVFIYEKVDNTFIQKATGHVDGQGDTFSTSVQVSVTYHLDVTDQTSDVTLDVPYTIQDPSRVYIGIRAYASYVTSGNISIRPSWGANKSSTRYTTGTAEYYSSTDGGATWSPYTDTAKPEIGVTFTHVTNAISPSLASVSGTQVVLPVSAIPAGPTGNYLTTEEAGVGILVDYYEADRAPLADIIRELIERAGLNPGIGDANLGLVTLYTIATSDYLTSIHEIIDARGYGIRDSVMDAGTVALLPEHTPDEAPVLSISNDPTSAAEKPIISYQLTAHWASEKATVAYIAENATASGLPLALETDDGLMDSSLINALQAPLSIISVDNTLGSHDIMAHRAAGAIRKLHTNTIEGTVVLAGYRPTVWDITGSKIGGRPIDLDVLGYGRGVVVPTEVELADGVTTVRLDNIRPQDRSGVAQSMGLVEGSVSNDATLLPKTVYIFAKADGDNQLAEGETIQSLDAITLVREDGSTIRQATAGYLRMVTDGAGYAHLLAVFPEAAGTYTSTSPVIMAIGEITTGGGSRHITALSTAHYILDNQNIHADIRLRNR